jgi:allophanate hydrolase subunit 2
MGPFGGRALNAGDELPVGSGVMPARAARPGTPLGLPAGGARVRVLTGPHHDRFDENVIRLLLASRFTIAPDSNRMGYRLVGPSLHSASVGGMLSDATPMGSIQVTGSGQPIVLMADRQTTGGYPRVATVISADLSLTGQLAPGDWIEFAACSRDEAVEALRQQELSLEQSC